MAYNHPSSIMSTKEKQFSIDGTNSPTSYIQEWSMTPTNDDVHNGKYQLLNIGNNP
jgi:hypothetical protein